MWINVFNVLNNVFTKRNLTDVKDHQKSKYLERALVEYHLPKAKNDFAANFDTVYQYLAKNYRNEYFVKNEMLNQMVLAKGTDKVSAFRELPIAQCIADFVINDKRSEVFEIKTDLDTLTRLPNQVFNYYQAFPLVSVITVEKHLQELKQNLPSPDLGIYLFTNDNRIECLKQPKLHFDQLNYYAMFTILRKGEQENILMKYFQAMPTCDIFHFYKCCYNLFKKIPIKTAQLEFEKQFKLRHLNVYPKNPNIMQKIPYSLREVIYFADFSRPQANKIAQVLNVKKG